MRVTVPVGLGEFVDKLTILEIKSQKISDQSLLEHVEKEKLSLERLWEGLSVLPEQKEVASQLKQKLKEVNLKLWDIEDAIRVKELEKDFAGEFVELARQVYLTNDQRFQLKNELNQILKSEFKEVKSHPIKV